MLIFKRNNDIKLYCLNKYSVCGIFGNGIDDHDKPCSLFGEPVWVTEINCVFLNYTNNICLIDMCQYN